MQHFPFQHIISSILTSPRWVVGDLDLRGEETEAQPGAQLVDDSTLPPRSPRTGLDSRAHDSTRNRKARTEQTREHGSEVK